MPGTREAPPLPNGSAAAPFWAFLSSLSRGLQPSSSLVAPTLRALPIPTPSPDLAPEPVGNRHDPKEGDEHELEDAPVFVGVPDGLEGLFFSQDSLGSADLPL